MENKSLISTGTLLRLALIFPNEQEVGKEIVFVCSNKQQRQPDRQHDPKTPSQE